MFDFMSGWFDEIRGLPLHPLVVHLVVVFLPISAIAMLVAIAVPKWRSPLQLWALAGLGIGTVGTWVAKVSGDSLTAAVGLPSDHAEWGNLLVPIAIGMFVVSAVWVWLSRRDTNRMERIASRSLGVVGGTLAVVVVGLTYVVGNSGARSTWEEPLAQAKEPPAVASEITGAISMAEVSQRNTRESCWSVVNDAVYDLTEFIARHPAGADSIVEMCGEDASEEFNGTHDGQAEPEEWLAVFKIGQVARS
jgi:uncharacterized membrane protein